MLESTADLLDGLFFIAMILLTAVCILGSIVAALRAVSRGTATSENIHAKPHFGRLSSASRMPSAPGLTAIGEI
jgi:hypothetical protein